jgi:hypothetical protein
MQHPVNPEEEAPSGKELNLVASRRLQRLPILYESGRYRRKKRAYVIVM